MTFTEGFAWVVFGVLIGWIGAILVRKPAGSMWTEVVAGVIGAFVGGWIGGAVFSWGMVGSIPVAGIVLAAVGAILLVWAVEAARRPT